MKDDEQQVLYRFFNAGDLLLYIGRTVNPGSRFKDHSKEQPWWSEVARIELEKYDTFEAVREAERLAILAERPIHNIQWNVRNLLPGWAVGLTDQELSDLLEDAEYLVDALRGQRRNRAYPKQEHDEFVEAVHQAFELNPGFLKAYQIFDALPAEHRPGTVQALGYRLRHVPGLRRTAVRGQAGYRLEEEETA